MMINKIGLVALVGVMTLAAIPAAEAKDRWGFSVSPYGSSFYYRTGKASFGFSTYPPVYPAPVVVHPAPVYPAPVYAAPHTVVNNHTTIVNNHYYQAPPQPAPRAAWNGSEWRYSPAYRPSTYNPGYSYDPD